MGEHNENSHVKVKMQKPEQPYLHVFLVPSALTNATYCQLDNDD